MHTGSFFKPEVSLHFAVHRCLHEPISFSDGRFDNHGDKRELVSGSFLLTYEYFRIGRVPKTLTFKMRPIAQPFL